MGFAMRCAPQNPPVSVLTKGFCDGATNFGPDKRVLRFGCAPQNPPVSVLIKGFCDGLVERGCAPRPTNFGPESALRCQDSCCTNPPLPLQAIPLPPAGNVEKRMACRAGSKDHSGTTLPVGGKGGTVARSAGCCHEIETPAGECLRRITITRQSASYFFLAKFAKCGIVTMSTGSLSSLPRPGL